MEASLKDYLLKTLTSLYILVAWVIAAWEPSFINAYVASVLLFLFLAITYLQLYRKGKDTVNKIRSIEIYLVGISFLMTVGESIYYLQ